MKMDQDKLTAQQRAAKIRWNLIVGKNTKGEPLWRVQWRDSGDTPMMRAVGKRGQVAKLWPKDPAANPADPEDTGPAFDLRAVKGWRRSWEETRRGRTERPDNAISYDEARDLAKAVVLKREQEIDAERAQRAAGRGEGPITFGQVAEDYIRAREKDVQRGDLKLGSFGKYRSMLRPPTGDLKDNEAIILRALGDVPITDVTVKMVRGFLAEQTDAGKAVSTVKLYRAAISGVLAHAAERELVPRNVTLDLPRSKRGGKSSDGVLKFYERHQVEAIAQQTDSQQMGDMIRLAMLTGLRKAELAALKWRSIDWTGQAVRVESTMVAGAPGGATENLPKSGEVRVVALSDQALTVLDRLSRRESFTGPNDRVFVTRTGGHLGASFVTDNWNRARDRWLAAEDAAGRAVLARDLTFHSTRHTFGVECARAGVPGMTIQGLMGHADLKMTQRYLHYAPQSSDAALLTRAFGGAVEQVQAAEPVTAPAED
jgi:integrase